MDDGEAPSPIAVESLVEGLYELAQCLHGATTARVYEWTSEHVSNAFGWASWVAYHLDAVEDRTEMCVHLDETLASWQHAAASEGAPGAEHIPVPRRAELALTVAELRSAQALLLRSLLLNPAASSEVARDAISNAVASLEGGVDATATALLPSARLNAQLHLLGLMTERAREARDGGGGLVSGSPPLAEAPSRAVAARAATAALIAAGDAACCEGLPAPVVGLAQWSFELRDAAAHGADGSASVALAALADDDAACDALFALPAELVAAALHASHVPPLVAGYCRHLHTQMLAFLSADGGADEAATGGMMMASAWGEWRRRWASLLDAQRGDPMTVAAATASLELEIGRLPPPMVKRLQYLTERMDDTPRA